MPPLRKNNLRNTLAFAYRIEGLERTTECTFVTEHKCSAEVTLPEMWHCVARSRTCNFVNEHKCNAEVTLP